jgi:hypothetical protein
VASIAGRALSFMLLAVVPLAACVSLKPPNRQPHPQSTVLLSVALTRESVRDAQPTGLIVGIDEQPGSAGLQFAFAPNVRIPGHYTTFLIRLDLPPGHHRLSRLSGVIEGGALAPGFDVTPQMSFEVRARTTDYLGHIEVRAPAGTDSVSKQTSVVIADAYESDLPNFIHDWPALRGHAIARRAPKGIAEISAPARESAAQQPAQGAGTQRSGQSGAPARLDATAAAGLPSQARAAFHSFLKSRYPRAFAVTDAGFTGTAVGGVDVINRALRKCRLADRVPEKSACRLFAVDDTLISSMQPVLPRVGKR